MKIGQLNDLEDHKAEENKESAIEEPEPSRRKLRAHFLYGGIRFRLCRLDQATKELGKCGGITRVMLLALPDREMKVRHRRDFNDLDLTRKPKGEFIFLHFLFEEPGSLQLVHVELQTAQQFLFHGVGLGSSIQLERDNHGSDLKMDIKKHHAGDKTDDA